MNLDFAQKQAGVGDTKTRILTILQPEKRGYLLYLIDQRILIRIKASHSIPSLMEGPVKLVQHC